MSISVKIPIVHMYTMSSLHLNYPLKTVMFNIHYGEHPLFVDTSIPFNPSVLAMKPTATEETAGSELPEHSRGGAESQHSARSGTA